MIANAIKLRTHFILVFAVVLLSLSPADLRAQAGSTILGTITDTSGAVVPERASSFRTT